MKTKHGRLANFVPFGALFGYRYNRYSIIYTDHIASKGFLDFSSRCERIGLRVWFWVNEP